MSRPPAPKKGWLAHYSGLVGTWAKGSSNPQDAEDAVQDAAERLLGSDTLAIRDTRAYLHRSAVNGLVSRRHREQAFPISPVHDLAEKEHPIIEDVESAAYVAQLSLALSESLEELPLVCRQIFAWHRIENWDGAGNRPAHGPVCQLRGETPDEDHAPFAPTVTKIRLVN